jgi:hypothetical protein
MKNIEMKVEGDILSIRIRLAEDSGLSSSGKSRIIASTEGNQPVEGNPGVFVGINCYKKISH